MRPFDGVLIVEGVTDHDGYSIREGALEWRTPIPIFDADRQRVLGHASGVTREGSEIRVAGSIDLPIGEYGVGGGIIVDAEEREGETSVVTAGRLFDAALTGTPSFEAARIHVRRDHIDDRVHDQIREGVREAHLGKRSD